MIKGVNRRIIEVSQTENKYFERALLFVNPLQQQTDEDKLHREADALLTRFSSTPCPSGREERHKKTAVRTAVWFGIGALCGAALMRVLLLF